MTVDRTNLRSAALQAVFMNDHDGVAAALVQLDQKELKALYTDAIRLASWVEGVLEADFTEALPPVRDAIYEAPLLTRRSERDPDQMFQTGP
jgi:hypothetical protein